LVLLQYVPARRQDHRSCKEDRPVCGYHDQGVRRVHLDLLQAVLAFADGVGPAACLREELDQVAARFVTRIRNISAA
jgi:hypothetical protein